MKQSLILLALLGTTSAINLNKRSAYTSLMSEADNVNAVEESMESLKESEKIVGDKMVTPIKAPAPETYNGMGVMNVHSTAILAEEQAQNRETLASLESAQKEIAEEEERK